MAATASMSQTSKSASTSAMLTPHLVCREASGATEFYKRPFGRRGGRRK